MSGPRIACIGIIGKADNPLHISTFPPYDHATIDMSFLLNSCLDIFEIRRKQTSVDQDLGLLHAIDETLAAYGWLTTTGVKFLIIVDFSASAGTKSAKQASPTVSGVRDSDLKPAFRALHNAYIQLLQNPFYSPDDHVVTPAMTTRSAPHFQPISNSKFAADVRRIGESWTPGTAA